MQMHVHIIVNYVHGGLIMIDEKKLIEEITNLYNEYANDQTRFEREETKAIYRFIGALTYRIENMPKVNNWIPVEERLPDKGKDVIVTYIGYNTRRTFQQWNSVLRFWKMVVVDK